MASHPSRVLHGSVVENWTKASPPTAVDSRDQTQHKSLQAIDNLPGDPIYQGTLSTRGPYLSEDPIYQRTLSIRGPYLPKTPSTGGPYLLEDPIYWRTLSTEYPINWRTSSKLIGEVSPTLNDWTTQTRTSCNDLHFQFSKKLF